MVQTQEQRCITVSHLWNGRMENQISCPYPPGVLQQSTLCVVMTCFNKQLQLSQLTHILGSSAGQLIQGESFFCLYLLTLISLLYNRADNKSMSCLSFHWHWSGPHLLLHLPLWLSKMRHIKTTLPHQVKGPSSLVPHNTWHHFRGKEWKTLGIM